MTREEIVKEASATTVVAEREAVVEEITRSIREENLPATGNETLH